MSGRSGLSPSSTAMSADASQLPIVPHTLSQNLVASTAEVVQHSSESLRFRSGEWLLLERWRDPRRPQARSERLYFQRSGTAPREALGEIAAAEAGAASLHMAEPELLCSGSRCAVVLGQYVFQRWERPQGPYWYRATTRPFGAAAFFLRTYWCQRQPRGSADRGLSLPEMAYAFGHLDLERNVLVTRQSRSDRRFPQFLVYSAQTYGTPWSFDAERTRRVNGINACATDGD
jgi:hypothetical protein